MKRDGDNRDSRIHTHLLPACPPHAVHRAIQAWQFRAELKWRKKPKIVRQGEGGGGGGGKQTWGVIGGMVRDRCNFQTTAGK